MTSENRRLQIRVKLRMYEFGLDIRETFEYNASHVSSARHRLSQSLPRLEDSAIGRVRLLLVWLCVCLQSQLRAMTHDTMESFPRQRPQTGAAGRSKSHANTAL